jgi:alpha-ketoglutarate-dependent taurine dioxygenase
MQAASTFEDVFDHAGTLAAEVVRHGWFKSCVPGAHGDVQSSAERIGMLLGEPIASRSRAVVELLAPTPEVKAHAKSLSAAHGLGSFPMHTDGAHRLDPPRFIVLFCASPGINPVPTILVRFNDLRFTRSERMLLDATPFLVRNGKRSFYSTITSASRSFIRFDEGCMVPEDGSGQPLFQTITQRCRDAPVFSINWKPGDYIVIDNWHVLHGRGVGAAESSPDRGLLRVSVR